MIRREPRVRVGVPPRCIPQILVAVAEIRITSSEDGGGCITRCLMLVNAAQLATVL